MISVFESTEEAVQALKSGACRVGVYPHVYRDEPPGDLYFQVEIICLDADTMYLLYKPHENDKYRNLWIEKPIDGFFHLQFVVSAHGSLEEKTRALIERLEKGLSH